MIQLAVPFDREATHPALAETCWQSVAYQERRALFQVNLKRRRLPLAKKKKKKNYYGTPAQVSERFGSSLALPSRHP